MPRTHRNPEQALVLLKQQEQHLKARRRQAEVKLRHYREREAAKQLANLVQVLKRYGVGKLTPERLELALTNLTEGKPTDNALASSALGAPATPPSPSPTVTRARQSAH